MRKPVLRGIALCALAALACPGVAMAADQTTAISTYPVEPVPPPPLPAPDPERLAIAERLVDCIWPVGTMQRIVETTMSTTVDAAAGLGELSTASAADGGDKAERRAQHEARTGRPLRGAPPPAPTPAEPSMADMAAIMAPIYAQMEPPMRAALTRIYARRYTVQQLGELEAFFSTPTGAAYAADSLTLMNEPEMVAGLTEAMGAMMSAIPNAMMDADAEGATAEAAAAVVEAAAADAAADAGVVKYE